MSITRVVEKARKPVGDPAGGQVSHRQRTEPDVTLDPAVVDVLESAARLQQLVPDAVLVGDGVLAAPERGELPEWCRLARAIGEQPWVQVARHGEQAVAMAYPFGVSEVMTDLIAEARQDAEAAERAAVAAEVREAQREWIAPTWRFPTVP